MDDNKVDFNQEIIEQEQDFGISNDETVSDHKNYEEEKPKKKKCFKGSAISYIAIALVASILGGIGSTYIGPSLYGNILPYPKGKEYTTQAINITTNDDLSTVTAVAKKAMSSVVGITTVETQNYFFTQQDVSGVGSGVIVDSNGYILTNSHVIADGNAKEIKVLFENGESTEGTVLWNDATLDLAVVKVDVTNLPVAQLGDSDNLEVGEIAIAIGNPLGLEFQRSVTSGIISGLNRSVSIDSSNIIENLIQTDASINPGNSGGPLLNGKGEVIGINTAKIKSAEGLGFSIPINEVKLIVEEIVNNGTYRTVFMGISGVSVDEYQTRLGIKLSVNKGIVLIEVNADSAASKAGLLAGDIITKLDDVEVTNMSQLKKSLYKYKQGDKAMITIMRNNEEKKLEIEFSNLQ